ncbi:MAG: O-methyltransferase-like protein [Frankiales bacterium]|nr:O-methyltransferase-like protein [Frankiales bacterium]
MQLTRNVVRDGIDRVVRLRGLDSVADVARSPDFPSLVEAVRAAGTDDIAHFGNGITLEGGLFLQQNPFEFAALCLWLRDRGPFTNYLEIGSASGGACLFLSEHVGFARPISIDDGNHPRASEQDRLLGQVPGLLRFRGDSHSPQARQFLVDNVEGKLDLAFVDGDHSYDGVMQDIALTLEFCRPGTLMVLHDITACEDVRRAWRDSVRRGVLKPLAELIGVERPLGIAIGAVR